MHRFSRFLRITGLGVGLAVGVASCSTSNWSPTHPSAIPDGGSFPKWDYNWDKREPYSLVKAGGSKKDKDKGESEEERLEKKRAKAIRHVILIRHGQYNLKGSCDEEKGLTPLGVEQAVLVGKRLKASGVKFSSLIASNMCRAVETANLILKEMGDSELGKEVKVQDPILREGAPCLPEPPVSSWHPDMHYYEDGARIEAAFRKYFHRADACQEEDSFEVIVCHANVIRYFVCRAMQFPPEAWLRISLNHTSLTMLSILPSGRVILRSLGDSGHLPAEKMTTS